MFQCWCLPFNPPSFVLCFVSLCITNSFSLKVTNWICLLKPYIFFQINFSHTWLTSMLVYFSSFNSCIIDFRLMELACHISFSIYNLKIFFSVTFMHSVTSSISSLCLVLLSPSLHIKLQLPSLLPPPKRVCLPWYQSSIAKLPNFPSLPSPVLGFFLALIESHGVLV
jgi:hypothetical protein